MRNARRAFFISSIEQYLAMAINVSVLAIMARILTPDAIGHAVTGISLGAIFLSLREFVTPEFLIQKTEIGIDDLRSSFTALLLVTTIVGTGIIFLSELAANVYETPEMPQFMALIVIAAFADVISQPIVAVLRRNMAFGKLTNIRTLALVASAATTIVMAELGFGWLSYGWGVLANSVTLALLSSLVTPYSLAEMCRPSVSSRKAILDFGIFKGASQAVDRIYENVPQLILGKMISMTSVGLYNRANTVCGIPDRIVMSAFYGMAFPTLAASVREGGNIKQAYLKVLTYLSVIYLPGVLMIAVTADPIVYLILGSQWHEAVLLVRIMSAAAIFWFAVIVTNPLLLALGHNRDAFLSGLYSRAAAAVALCSASMHGIVAMALSQFVSLPIQMLIALYFARKHLHFSLKELSAAVCPSLLVTLVTLVGPLTILAMGNWRTDMSLERFGLTLGSASLGWLVGLGVTGHPFMAEVRWLWKAIIKAPTWLRRRLVAREV